MATRFQHLSIQSFVPFHRGVVAHDAVLLPPSQRLVGPHRELLENIETPLDSTRYADANAIIQASSPVKYRPFSFW